MFIELCKLYWAFLISTNVKVKQPLMAYQIVVPETVLSKKLVAGTTISVIGYHEIYLCSLKEIIAPKYKVHTEWLSLDRKNAFWNLMYSNGIGAIPKLTQNYFHI